VKKAKDEKPVNVNVLMTDMDRLIAFNHSQNKACQRIVLTPDQYAAFLQKNHNQPYYRNVLVVSQ
jgi:hypothetical protein